MPLRGLDTAAMSAAKVTAHVFKWVLASSSLSVFADAGVASGSTNNYIRGTREIRGARTTSTRSSGAKSQRRVNRTIPAPRPPIR
jgi:hypothetical protein